MKVKVSEALGVVLDWMVAKCEGCDLSWDENAEDFFMGLNSPYCFLREFSPSTNWYQGGPIIKQLRSDSAYQFLIESDGDNVHVLSWPSEHVHFSGYGPTILIATMRCLVTSRLGEEVEVPDELLKT